FWKRAGYAPVYMRQTSNELTGEYTCVMLNELATDGLAVRAKQDWLDAFARDFHRRFATLLSYSFKDFTVVLAMSILDAARAGRSAQSLQADASVQFTRDDLERDFSGYDLKRLESYANNMLDYHVILDLLPVIAQRYFGARYGSGVSLSGVQACILLGIGLQHKSVDAVEKELNLPSRQILALFTKILRKFSNFYRDLETKAIEDEFDQEHGEEKRGAKRSLTDDAAWDPTKQTLAEELDEAGREVSEEFKEKQRELIDAMDMSQYAIGGEDKDWEAAESQIRKAGSSGSVQTVVSVKNMESSKRARTEKKVAAGLAKAEEAHQRKAAARKPTKVSKKTKRT
ncbi:N-acetyltransferase 10, partial [Linderina pennispora]